MNALAVARKTLVEFWREPQLLGLLLVFPPLLILMYYLAFGQSERGLASVLQVMVINNDVGAAQNQGEYRRAGAQLVDMLRQAEFDGKPVFTIVPITDRAEGEIALRERKAGLALIIPADFTQSLSGARAAPPTLTFLGDPSSDNYVFADSFLDDMMRQFVASSTSPSAEIKYEFLPGTGTMSDFQYGVPGTIIFGIVFLVVPTATVLVRERARGTLRRLRLTRLSAGHLLTGLTLAQLALAVLVTLVTFGTALALGFESPGSIPLMMGIALLFSLAPVGLGLIVACFSNNDGEAVNLSTGVLVPLVFLSGAVFPMPPAPLFSIAGRSIQVYDLMPSTHAGAAMRRIMVFGQGPGAILYELGAMAVLSLLYLAIGVILYQKLRMDRA